MCALVSFPFLLICVVNMPYFVVHNTCADSIIGICLRARVAKLQLSIARKNKTVYPCSDEEARLREDAHVKKVMLDQGIKAVRGGS